MTGVFLLLALSFVFDMWGGAREVVENPLIDPEEITTSTVRNPLTGPVIRQAGFKYSCNECHQHFKPSAQRNPLQAAHQNIVMEHGINNTCFNCHQSKESEFLSDINGKNVSMVQSELLCQKCHGARFRDWKIGVHGRQNGFWDKNQGESTRATCVACHNPHSPKFKPMKPLPGPIRSSVPVNERGAHE